MAEYIDREAIIHWLTKPKGFKRNCKGCLSSNCLDCVIDEITYAPAADVVEVEELIAKIEREIEDKNTSSSLYVCEDGTEIHTDVGCVQDWFDYYADVIRRWAKGGRSDGKI